MLEIERIRSVGVVVPTLLKVGPNVRDWFSCLCLFSGVTCSRSGGNCFLKDVKHGRMKPGESEVTYW